MFLYRIFLKYFILFVVTVFLFVFTGNLFAQDDEDGCHEVEKKSRKTFESAQ